MEKDLEMKPADRLDSIEVQFKIGGHSPSQQLMQFPKNDIEWLIARVRTLEGALKRIENCMFHYETYGPEATIAGCVCTANLALEGEE